MRGRRLQVIVNFPDILAMVAFRICKPEETLFQDWIAAAPESERKTQSLLIIADAPMPSSPHLYARLLARWWLKSSHAVPLSL